MNWIVNKDVSGYTVDSLNLSGFSKDISPSSSRVRLIGEDSCETRFMLKKKFALQKKLKVLLVEDNSFSIQNF